jgi:hypothetical protein
MGRFLEKFRKIPKMSGKKKIIFPQTRAAGYVICTSIQLQHFFFGRICFLWGKLGKIFFDPTNKPRECVRRAFNPASEASLVRLFVVLFV